MDPREQHDVTSGLEVPKQVIGSRASGRCHDHHIERFLDARIQTVSDLWSFPEHGFGKIPEHAQTLFVWIFDRNRCIGILGIKMHPVEESHPSGTDQQHTSFTRP